MKKENEKADYWRRRLNLQQFAEIYPSCGHPRKMWKTPDTGTKGTCISRAKVPESPIQRETACERFAISNYRLKHYPPRDKAGRG